MGYSLDYLWISLHPSINGISTPMEYVGKSNRSLKPSWAMTLSKLSIIFYAVVRETSFFSEYSFKNSFCTNRNGLEWRIVVYLDAIILLFEPRISHGSWLECRAIMKIATLQNRFKGTFYISHNFDEEVKGLQYFVTMPASRAKVILLVFEWIVYFCMLGLGIYFIYCGELVQQFQLQKTSFAV